MKWTAEEIPDLTGKVALVTGGNSGLGFESVKALAEQGAEVIMACRSKEKGEKAKEKIQIKDPSAQVMVEEFDLDDLQSVAAFAERIKKKYRQLDILLNNAGIMMVPYGTTKQGFERQFGVNHLGHFALTGQLLELLLSTPGSRIVNVSSLAHRQGIMDFENLKADQGKDYNRSKAYHRSKLANLYFTFHLQHLLSTAGKETICLAAHPGVSMTNLANHMVPGAFRWLLKPLFSLMTQPAWKGALPQLYAATHPDVRGGDYYGPDSKSEWKGYPGLAYATETARDAEAARKLWEISGELTGIEYQALNK